MEISLLNPLSLKQGDNIIPLLERLQYVMIYLNCKIRNQKLYRNEIFALKYNNLNDPVTSYLFVHLLGKI